MSLSTSGTSIVKPNTNRSFNEVNIEAREMDPWLRALAALLAALG